MSNRIVICDSERNYAEHLMEYLRRRLPDVYEMEMFTSEEKLLEIGNPKESALLIVSEREYDPRIADAGYDQVLVLNETGVYMGEDICNVSKYQSIDTISAIVRQLCASGEKSESGMIRHTGPLHILGVYTPITRCLQTTFSLTMGQFLSRKGKVLYLNFENFSGLDHMLGRTFRGTVADIVYYNDCAKEKLMSQLSMLVENVGGVDMIPPMKSFIELRAIRENQWLDLFSSIERFTEYEYLILDLSEMTDGLLTILRECERIFTISRADSVSEAKMQGYEDLLRSAGYEDIASRTKRWQFPVFRELPASLENLTHGEMADYVRRLLDEEGYGRTAAVG